MSRRSAPDENARPAPVRRTARTPGSSAASRRAASRSSPSRRFQLFSDSGRSRTIVAAAPSRRTETVSRSGMAGRYRLVLRQHVFTPRGESTYFYGPERTGCDAGPRGGGPHPPRGGGAGGGPPAGGRGGPPRG